ncbi:MAG: hypothetical protein JO360_04880 [Acidobacteria bacterium]|nr:hypothetical protein [Acidobacteriota bacterium]
MNEATLRTIVVAGIASGAGKTSVAEAVTGHMAGLCPTAAAKITVTHGERGCPHGGKGCNVCSSLGGDFQLIERTNIIAQPGTDTARLLDAGGRPVVWAITRDVAIGAAWRELHQLLKSAACAVIESNTLAEHIKPTLTLMIVDPTISRRIWKSSAERLIAKADCLIFNERGTQAQHKTLLEEITRLRGHTDDLVRVSHPHELTTQATFREKLQAVCRANVAGC